MQKQKLKKEFPKKILMFELERTSTIKQSALKASIIKKD